MPEEQPPAAILDCRSISKQFPGVKALDGVDFRVGRGEVHALIGENGAGKSTLVRILTGIHRPDSGQILFDGRPVAFDTPLDSQAAGIAAIHQEATMFPELTVTENVFMGHHLRAGGSPLLSWRGMRGRTVELLAQLEVDLDPDAPVKSLSVAQRHMVEIVKALSLDALLVIMDEPTSALSLREARELYAIIRRLKAAGRSVVFISHKFEDIYEIADRFTVLRDGRRVGDGVVRDTDVDAIIRMMVGRSLTQMYPKTPGRAGEVLLDVRGLTRTGVFRDVTFTLHRGEILGFFGLVGAGRSEVMRAVFGIDAVDGGVVTIERRRLRPADPLRSLEAGLAYVPEDRQAQGVILDMNIRENTTLPILARLTRGPFLSLRKEMETTERHGRRMEIKCSSWEQAVSSLSGGNQQKVVLAKWLATEPKVLILDEPTKGIDVGTKARVHEFISALAQEGLGIVLVSSELPEILGMSDTIVVMHEGRITARVDRGAADQDSLIRAAVGTE